MATSKKINIVKRILFSFCAIVLGIILLIALLFGFLTLREFRPDSVERILVQKNSSSVSEAAELFCEKSFTVVSWNTGYGALGDNADFFMDGGKHVMTADKARVQENLKSISQNTKAFSPDIVFFQEVDQKATRSHKINQLKYYSDFFTDFQFAYARNFLVDFIPYPIPPIGKVDAGIVTLSQYALSDCERIQLPCPFSWPLRIGNLKRCLLVSRVPVAETQKELVLVNLHLEAYDSGEGKIAQTAMLKNFLEAEYQKGNYVIAAGDFNQTFSTVDKSAFPVHSGMWLPGEISAEDFPVDWKLLMDSRTASCRSLDRPFNGENPSEFQFYIIDGFIVSPNVQVLDFSTRQLNFAASDHNPVLLTAQLKK